MLTSTEPARTTGKDLTMDGFEYHTRITHVMSAID